jgi:hypothetical protein
MARHRIHDHHQNLAYHFPKSSRGSTPAPVRASSLSAEGGLRQVFVLLFCAVRSSVYLARPLLLLDLSQTDTWCTSRCSFSIVSLLRSFQFHRTFGRTCMFVLGPLLQAHTTILPSQTLAIPPGTSFAGSVEYLSILVSAVLGVGRDPIFPSDTDSVSAEHQFPTPGYEP